jgi:transposase
MTGRVVYLHFEKARVRCCGRQPETEHLPWVEKSSQQTVRLKWSIYEECKDASVKAVAAKHDLSWDEEVRPYRKQPQPRESRHVRRDVRLSPDAGARSRHRAHG